MQRIFTFGRTAVMTRHWFEIGVHDGVMEHGSRLELRLLAQEPRRGTDAAAQRIVLDQPLWRADLFDRLDREPGTYSAGHYHPTFDGNEPSARAYAVALKQDPWTWATDQLSRVEDLCAANGITGDWVAEDARDIRTMVDQMIEAAQRLAPTECDSVQTCHALTKDVSAAVRLMANQMDDMDQLDRAYVAPWLEVESISQA